MSHEANDGEDDEAGEDAGGAVGEGDEDGVPVAVVGELVVAGEGDQASEAGSKRVENLGGSVSPNLAENGTVYKVYGRLQTSSCLDILQSSHFLCSWVNIEKNSLVGSWQSGASYKQDKKNQIPENKILKTKIKCHGVVG